MSRELNDGAEPASTPREDRLELVVPRSYRELQRLLDEPGQVRECPRPARLEGGVEHRAHERHGALRLGASRRELGCEPSQLQSRPADRARAFRTRRARSDERARRSAPGSMGDSSHAGPGTAPRRAPRTFETSPASGRAAPVQRTQCRPRASSDALPRRSQQSCACTYAARLNRTRRQRPHRRRSRLRRARAPAARRPPTLVAWPGLERRSATGERRRDGDEGTSRYGFGLSHVPPRLPTASL
jgi:hypothetical protein